MTTPTQTLSVRGGTSLSGPGLVRFLQLERQYLNAQDKLAISARLRDAREKAGYGEREFGDMLDPPVTDRSIRNYESGKPAMRFLRQWAEITNVSFDWLLRGEGDPRGERLDLVLVLDRLEELSVLVARGFEALGVPPDALQPGEDEQTGRTEEG